MNGDPAGTMETDMPCDSRLKPRQTISQRKTEVKKVVDRLANQLVSGRVKVKIGPQGAVAFDGLTDEDRDGVTDACAYRLLMVSGSPLAIAKLQQAEMLAGRSIDRTAIGQGWHSHDGGRTFEKH